jgi:hypothetical protein
VSILITPGSAGAFDPALEARNFAKTGERMRYVTLTAEFQARLARQNAQDSGDLATIAAAETGQGADARNFTGDNLLTSSSMTAGGGQGGAPARPAAPRRAPTARRSPGRRSGSPTTSRSR